MTTQRKTLILMGLTLIGLTSILYVTLKNNLISPFKKLEEQNTRRKVEHVLDTLSNELDRLTISDSDWSSFAEDPVRPFIESNLLTGAMIQARLHVLLFIDPSGRLILTKGFDPQRQMETPVPEGLGEHLSRRNILSRHTNRQERQAGLLLLPDGPMLIAFQPVFAGDNKSSFRGTLILGRYLNADETERISKRTRLSLTFYGAEEKGMPSDFKAVRGFLEEIPIVVQYFTPEEVAGYTLLRDLDGKPALVLRASEPRVFYKQGQSALKYNILAVLLLVLISTLLILLIIRRFFLLPLSRLSTTISDIGESGDLSARVSVKESDQVSRLAGEAINTMLESLETSQQKLRKSEERYRTLVETIPYGIHEITPSGTITFANVAFHRIHGYEPGELMGTSITDLIVSDSEPYRVPPYVIPAPGARPDPVPWTGKTRRKDGRIIDAQIDWNYKLDPQGNVTGFISILTDITKRRRAEEERERLENQLRHTQKIEAIGTLAGGIAHDFNNILGAILLNTEMVLQDLPEENPGRLLLHRVLNASYRARDLVKQILTFSRRNEQEKTPMHLAPVVKEALTLLQSSLPSTIEIQRHIADDAGSVLVDPTQIHQVLINLCTNAAHAMREKGGILHITLENAELDDRAPQLHPDLHPGPYVKLEVSDTGHGIRPEIADRIFDPFFTTKSPDEGTGMGLAVVHGIVKGYNGAILVRSEPEKGTVFTVFLPEAEKKTDEGPVERGRESTALSSRLPASSPERKEHILFVDDEEFLVNSWKPALERPGYRVTGKTGSIEALEAFRAHPHRFDLVVTDLTMPQQSGLDLAVEILRLRPDIPIILCTGFGEAVPPETLRKIGIRGIALKPVAAHQMIELIGKTLQAGRGSEWPGS